MILVVGTVRVELTVSRLLTRYPSQAANPVSDSDFYFPHHIVRIITIFLTKIARDFHDCVIVELREPAIRFGVAHDIDVSVLIRV